MNEFQPISLIGCIYKIIAKILASRLKRVLLGIISLLQTTFLQGRQNLEGILVENEIINIVKRKKWPMYMFKVDFQQAYDRVSWKFLEYMMVRMGFNTKWRKWMAASVFSGSISVLVNGSPSTNFSMGRGLRQGDPIAPFLFLKVAEGLTN